MRHALNSELLALRAEKAGLACEIALPKISLALRRYSPDQPRGPAGQSGGGRWAGRDASIDRVRVAEIESGSLIAELPYRGGGRYCVYRFSYGDVFLSGPNIARCSAKMFWFGAVHGTILNDNRRP